MDEMTEADGTEPGDVVIEDGAKSFPTTETAKPVD
jgi:hypothetical protein